MATMIYRQIVEDRTIVGQIVFVQDAPGVIHVHAWAVEKSHQMRGIAERALRDLQREYPQHVIQGDVISQVSLRAVRRALAEPDELRLNGDQIVTFAAAMAALPLARDDMQPESGDNFILVIYRPRRGE